MIKDLMEFGLSEKEAKVYLALLELGMAPAHAVAEATEIKRPTVYVILENLKKQGFVNLAQNDNIQQYIAASPDIFLRMAEKRADQENKLHNQIKNLIPDLKGLHKENKQRPKVRVFEGKEGLINAIQEGIEAASAEKMYRAFTSGSTVYKTIPEFIEKWLQMDMELGIQLYGIYVDDDITRKMQDARQGLSKIVYLPKEKHPLPADIMIAGNKIGYLSVSKNKITTIIIEDKEISFAMKAMFDLAFEEVKRIGDYQEKK